MRLVQSVLRNHEFFCGLRSLCILFDFAHLHQRALSPSPFPSSSHHPRLPPNPHLPGTSTSRQHHPSSTHRSRFKFEDER